ncbi:MAG: chemotaxis protein [Marinoscillum sp.]
MINSKFKWVIGLSLVFALILTTNVIDRNNFKRIKDSILSIYEDRLIAKNFVFELSLLLEEKSMALATADSTFFTGKNKGVNDQIRNFISQFWQTKLTAKEATTLKSFEDDFDKLVELELALLPQLNDQKADHKLKTQIQRLKTDLYTLSEIQISEGKKQFLIGAQAADSVELLTKLEIIMLVIIAGLVQFILLYNPKKSQKSPTE